MADKPFQFKKFSVRNTVPGLKVGTDGVLLGAAAHPAWQKGDESGICSADDSTLAVLDIGTGTGVIALMLAQRYPQAHITAIDIDADAAKEAKENFAGSPWADRLSALHCSLENYTDVLTTVSHQERGNPAKYDLIVSNPPYYDNSLSAGTQQRNLARHTVAMGYADIVKFATIHLDAQGTLALILPSQEETRLRRFAASYDLSISEITYIKTTTAKATSRIIVHLEHRGAQAPTSCPKIQAMTIREGNAYSKEYCALLADFLISL